MEKAIVTIPTSFNSDQIAATKKAVEMAGLKVKDLLQEPTAAIIAYIEKYKLGRSKILVFDFGGGFTQISQKNQLNLNSGTLDITIAQINNNEYELKATAGDAHLGNYHT